MAGSDGMARMQQSLASGIETARRYEDPALKAAALSLVPADTLKERALASPSPLPGRDEELKQLLNWFKHSFFTWMNNPACTACGNKNTSNCGKGPPNEEERRGDAGVVELYSCPSCNTVTRFPRYNNPATLLETRTGRCGEWANAFTLFCRALEFDARWVHDWTDHVWTEVWSDSQNKWLHCDSCENVLDKPLIYEAGWNKALSYIIGFSRDEVADVTRRYTRKWTDVLSRRNSCPEGWLEMTIAQINFATQAQLPVSRSQLLQQRARAEQDSLVQGSMRELTPEEQVGRQTGSAEWRRQRGEIGTQPGVCVSSSLEIKSSWIPHVWQVGDGIASWRLMYSSVRDAYFVEAGDSVSPTCRGTLAPEVASKPACRGWQSGAAAKMSMKRNEEEDWNMVYLARAENGQNSYVQWTIQWIADDASGSKIQRKLRHASILPRHSLHHEDACVTWSLSTDCSNWCGLDVPVSTEQPLELLNRVGNNTQLHIRAEMKGGNWQQTQLFRQSREELYRCELDLVLGFEFVLVGVPEAISIEQAIQRILTNPVEIQTLTLSLIRTLASNIEKSPEEGKYRSIRLTNNKIALGIVRPRGAVQALMASGWKLQENNLTLPADEHLDGMRRLIALLPKEAVSPCSALILQPSSSSSSAASGYPVSGNQAQQTGNRMKELFAKFKAEGMEANAAAAKAVQIAKSEWQGK